MIISHIPRHYVQMERYYEYYSIATRGRRGKLGMDGTEIPAISNPLGEEHYCTIDND